MKYTAPITGNATATTCDLASFDTRLVVYPGASCPTSSADSIACNNDACSATTSSVTWAVTAGSTWYIRIGSTANVGGAGTLRLSEIVPCLGDLDGDNEVNSADLGQMLGGFGTCGVTLCIEDLNGDSVVNSEDLGALLGNFGPCP